MHTRARPHVQASFSQATPGVTVTALGVGAPLQTDPYPRATFWKACLRGWPLSPSLALRGRKNETQVTAAPVTPTPAGEGAQLRKVASAHARRSPSRLCLPRGSVPPTGFCASVCFCANGGLSVGPQPGPRSLVPEPPPPAACHHLSTWQHLAPVDTVPSRDRGESASLSQKERVHGLPHTWPPGNRLAKHFHRRRKRLFRKIILQKIKQTLYQNNS